MFIFHLIWKHMDPVPVVLRLNFNFNMYVCTLCNYVCLNTHVRPVLQRTWPEQESNHWDFSPLQTISGQQATNPQSSNIILHNLTYTNRKIHLVFLPSNISIRFSSPHSRSFAVAKSAIFLLLKKWNFCCCLRGKHCANENSRRLSRDLCWANQPQQRGEGRVV